MSSRRAPDRRVRWGLAAAAGAAACAVLAAAATTAQAAPSPAAAVPAVGLAAAAVPTTTTSGTRTLIVDPAENLAPEGATINVQGSGFGTDHGLYVAVCAEGSGAPENLAACVGGAIPDANTTQSWAHITESGQGGSGGVQAAWGENGSFSVSLTLASVTTEALNCVAQRCALYTTSDDDSDRTQDTAVPLTFSGAPASSTPSTPGTAIPQVVQSAEIQPGGTQLVVFSGFQPNETVGLTLFSREVTLTPVNADTTGVARAQFVVPSDFVVGTHRLEAVGQSSGTVGVASFEVVAPPPPTPSSTPTPTPSPTPTPTPTPSETPTPTPTPTPTTATSSVAADDTSTSSSLWWLWLLLAIIVIAGIITWIVIYQRNKKIAAEREQYERDRAAAAAAEQQRLQGAPPGADAPTMYLPPAATAGGPPPGADPYGLLSGRDEPYPPAGPTDLIVGAGPTQVIGGPPGSAGAQDYQPPPPGPHAGEGPPTEEIPPIRESSAAPGSSAEPPGSSAAPGSSAGSSAAPPPDRSSDTLRGSPQEQTGALTPPFDDDEPPEGRPRDRG